jgi:hypothetical protein
MGVNSLLKELEEVMIYDSVGKRQISYQFYNGQMTVQPWPNLSYRRSL